MESEREGGEGERGKEEGGERGKRKERGKREGGVYSIMSSVPATSHKTEVLQRQNYHNNCSRKATLSAYTLHFTQTVDKQR